MTCYIMVLGAVLRFFFTKGAVSHLAVTIKLKIPTSLIIWESRALKLPQHLIEGHTCASRYCLHMRKIALNLKSADIEFFINKGYTSFDAGAWFRKISETGSEIFSSKRNKTSHILYCVSKLAPPHTTCDHNENGGINSYTADTANCRVSWWRQCKQHRCKCLDSLAARSFLAFDALGVPWAVFVSAARLFWKQREEAVSGVDNQRWLMEISRK